MLTYFNQYESKRHFTLKLSEALNRLGVKTLIADPEKGEISNEIKKSLFEFSPDCLFSFNSSLPDKAGKYLGDYLQIPSWVALVDPAFYSIEMTRSLYTKLTTVDREDCKWLLDNGVKNTFFWPHGVEADLSLTGNEERPFDVVFLGTCTDFEGLKMQWNTALDDSEKQVLNSAIQIMMTPPGNSLTKALALSVSSFPAIDPRSLDFKSIFHFLDNYVRGKDRYELIRSIKTAKVHIFGEPSWNNLKGGASWKEYLKNQPNVVLHQPVSYAESFEISKQAKICLNSSPFFRHGSHERILNAFMSGAVPLTTHNGFVEEFFQPDVDLISYQTGDYSQVDDKVNGLLSNESKRSEMAVIGRQKVLENHTWDIRAKQLLDHINTR